MSAHFRITCKFRSVQSNTYLLHCREIKSSGAGFICGSPYKVRLTYRWSKLPKYMIQQIQDRLIGSSPAISEHYKMQGKIRSTFLWQGQMPLKSALTWHFSVELSCRANAGKLESYRFRWSVDICVYIYIYIYIYIDSSCIRVLFKIENMNTNTQTSNNSHVVTTVCYYVCENQFNLLHNHIRLHMFTYFKSKCL